MEIYLSCSQRRAPSAAITTYQISSYGMFFLQSVLAIQRTLGFKMHSKLLYFWDPDRGLQLRPWSLGFADFRDIGVPLPVISRPACVSAASCFLVSSARGESSTKPTVTVRVTVVTVWRHRCIPYPSFLIQCNTSSFLWCMANSWYLCSLILLSKPPQIVTQLPQTQTPPEITLLWVVMQQAMTATESAIPTASKYNVNRTSNKLGLPSWTTNQSDGLGSRSTATTWVTCSY